MPHWVLMIFAGMAAFVIPFQSIINGQLGKILQHPFYAAFISFFGGVISLAVLVLITTPGIPPWPKNDNTPWYLFIGGPLGVVFVTTILIVTPKIGAANVLAAAVVGQLVMAMVIDHYGILGTEIIRIGWNRILGTILLFGGLLLIQNR